MPTALDPVRFDRLRSVAGPGHYGLPDRRLDDGQYGAMPGQERSSRRLRRKLGAPRSIRVVWDGPPTLSLASRSTLLKALREDIDTCGLSIAEVRGGWSYRVRAVEGDARSVLQADERTADERGHWWRQDAVWRSTDGSSVLVYRADPDGSDLTFMGWGRQSATCLDAVRARLEIHQS